MPLSRLIFPHPQQILGSISPPSISTTRLLPMAVLNSTRPFSQAMATGLIRSLVRRSCRLNTRDTLGQDQGKNLALPVP